MSAADRALRAVLTSVLTAPQPPPGAFSSALLERVPVERIAQMVEQLRERHGAVRSVQPYRGLWRVQCAAGSELLWARLDGDGLLGSLVLGPAALTARLTAAEEAAGAGPGGGGVAGRGGVRPVDGGSVGGPGWGGAAGPSVADVGGGAAGGGAAGGGAAVDGVPPRPSGPPGPGTAAGPTGPDGSARAARPLAAVPGPSGAEPAGGMAATAERPPVDTLPPKPVRPPTGSTASMLVGPRSGGRTGSPVGPRPRSRAAAENRRTTARRYTWLTAAAAGWTVLHLALAVTAATATGWFLLLLAALAVGWCVRHAGPWHALPPYARLLPAAAVCGTLLAGLRVLGADLAWSLGDPLALVPPLAALAAAGWTAARCRPAAGPADPPPLALASPLRGGTFGLLQAGGPALNRHAADGRDPAARHACDLTALGSGPRWRHRRALGLMPAANSSYAVYGHLVCSPCQGTVVAAVDGLPDHEPGAAADPAHPLGNHIALDTGLALVVLAHLRPGSIRVPVGAAVRTGTPLAAVGNSGDTGGEPLLQLRAETRGTGPGSGVALPLILAELPGPPLRGRRFTA
ncbi:hypothetical protein ACIQGZ_03545 [Streptomyces sp. NPDC092296]|uniref:hypothetical protein n=1 Tax=Streptomyces sp. NPDC092296 TaxID=3366012 RepID=UPI00382B4C18